MKRSVDEIRWLDIYGGFVFLIRLNVAPCGVPSDEVILQVTNQPSFDSRYVTKGRSMVSATFPTRRFVLTAMPWAVLACTLVAKRAHASAHQRYICVASDCTPYIYDPAVGDPDSGIPPGTPFADLPSDWYCPDCGAAKADFIPLG